jgi:hypothetical protein
MIAFCGALALHTGGGKGPKAVGSPGHSDYIIITMEIILLFYFQQKIYSS